MHHGSHTTCPKCGYASGNEQVCESCGALISRIRSRSDEGFQADVKLEPFDPASPVRSGSAFLAKAVAFCLVVVCVGGGYFLSQKHADKQRRLADELAESRETLPFQPALTPVIEPQMEEKEPPEQSRKRSSSQPTAGESEVASLLGRLSGKLNGAAQGQATEAERRIQFSESPEPASSTPAAKVVAESAATAAPRQSAPSSTGKPARAPSKPGGKAKLQGQFSTREKRVPIELGEEMFSTGGSESLEVADLGRAPEAKSNDAASDEAARGAPASASYDASATVGSVRSATFTSEVLNHSGGPVLVDFFATWCGPCRKLAPRLEAVARHYGPQLKVVKLDIDQNPDIASRYRVNSFPTLVLFNHGSEMDRGVGLLETGEIKQIVDANL